MGLRHSGTRVTKSETPMRRSPSWPSSCKPCTGKCSSTAALCKRSCNACVAKRVCRLAIGISHRDQRVFLLGPVSIKLPHKAVMTQEHMQKGRQANFYPEWQV